MTSSLTAITGGLPSPLDTLAAALAGGGAGATAPAATPRPTAASRASASAGKATTTQKAAAKKATAAKKTTVAKKATAAKARATGYATRLPADYAFLRDPKLSIEEKLSRFIGMLMAKSEQDLLRQMEKMAPGSAPASSGSGGASGAAKPKSTKLSLWGLAKGVFPALNLASKVVGDAQLKQLASQLSGPVLAAACTAVGLPQLAPLALKYGPQLVGALAKDITLDLGLLTGGGASGAGSAASGGGAAKSGSAEPATSEKAQLMELQRLQDRDRELFTLFSNMLKAMHDARMTAIQNVR